ncbi:MAG: hypothetical protein KF771_03910 [Burkholderiales bacterium]|nr:hypothetical protein [Burkholderiales bacterium]
MEIDNSSIRDALRRLIQVERQHLFGEKSGSSSARRAEVEKEVNRLISELTVSAQKTKKQK